MTGISKVVAAVLLVAALAGPAAVLAVACMHGNTTDCVMKCCGGCPMMARKSAFGHRLATPHKAPCCEMSSGQTVAASVAASPVSPVTAVPVALRASAHVPLPASRERNRVVSETPPVDSSPQAELCTFLI